MYQDDKATWALELLLEHIARAVVRDGHGRREAAKAAADAAADLAEALDNGGTPSLMTWTKDGVRLDPGEDARWIKVPAHQREQAS